MQRILVLVTQESLRVKQSKKCNVSPNTLMKKTMPGGTINCYLSKCSTPTSSASSAPISLAMCSNVFVVGVPS